MYLVGCDNCAGARVQAARRSRVGVRGVGKQRTPRWVARSGAGEEENQRDDKQPIVADDERQRPSDAKVIRV